MQNVQISAGKAVCRYCGESYPTKRLLTHILKAHPRPLVDLSPKLIRKRA